MTGIGDRRNFRRDLKKQNGLRGIVSIARRRGDMKKLKIHVGMMVLVCIALSGAALAAAKRKGRRLGNPDRGAALVAHVRANGNGAAIAGKSRAADARAEAWRGTIESMIADGMGNTAIARTLNEQGEPSVTGAGAWTATAVRRLRQRLGLGEATAKAA